MAQCACYNHHFINTDDAIGTSHTANSELANAPNTPVDDTVTNGPNQSGNTPRHMSEEPQNFKTCFEELDNEFRAFRSEFSEFHMDHISINIQADLENLQNAQIILNETLTSKIDVIGREINAHMNDLK